MLLQWNKRFFPNATLATLEKPSKSLTESVPFFIFILPDPPADSQPPGDAGLLRAQGASIHLPRAPKTACSDAHASLCTVSPFTVKLRLALSALGTAPMAGGRGRGGRCWLRGDGAQQVVAFAQEVSTGPETEASLSQSHACAASLGRSGALTVLQMGQMRSVTIRDELQWGKEKLGN